MKEVTKFLLILVVIVQLFTISNKLSNIEYVLRNEPYQHLDVATCARMVTAESYIACLEGHWHDEFGREGPSLADYQGGS